MHGQTQALTSLIPVADLACVLAMMVPLVLPTLRRTAFASLWQRRQQAMVECLLGYVLVWIACALVLGVVGHGSTVLGGQPILIGSALLVALAWQRTAMKHRALRACHLMLPLAPRGWRADRDCLRLGVTVGVNCIINCWPLMALAAASEHQPLVVLAISVALLVERLGRYVFADTARAIVLEVQRGSGSGRLANTIRNSLHAGIG
jgi:predicted metal-binding membrane protein